MSDVSKRPNILIVLTDQQRFPTSYEPEGLRQWRRDKFAAERSLSETGVSFTKNYVMATACAPSRASLLTGQYPSLHGVTQTDGLGKSFDSPDMFWLAPDTVPTIGDWFRAGGYRTFLKGKWHASHVALEDPSGEGLLLSIDDEGNRIEENIAAYLEADLLDGFGFSEWVGPEPHGLGKHNTGTVKDVFTADETIALLQRFDADDSEQPWLTMCSFLNPHDSSLFGVLALKQGLRYHPSRVPSIPKPPTHHEDLSTKPRCQQSYADEWKMIAVPQPWIELHRKFYYQMQHAVDAEIARVLDALARAEITKTRSSCSALTTVTCSAPTVVCTRSGTTPTRSPSTSRSSWQVHSSTAVGARSMFRPAMPISFRRCWAWPESTRMSRARRLRATTPRLDPSSVATCRDSSGTTGSISQSRSSS
jgi:arylsulfatase A-like enzyme